MGFPYKSILCPIDFDDNSLAALDQALAMARHFKARVILVHVVPMVIQFGDVPLPVELFQEQTKGAKAKLGEIAKAKLGDFEHEAVLYTGDVAGSIVEAIAKFNPDLVVMATHGRGGFAHLFLGSVTEIVVRKSKSPVLTIRSGQTSPSRK